MSKVKEALLEMARVPSYKQFYSMLRTGYCENFGATVAEIGIELGCVAGDKAGNEKKLQNFYYGEGRKERKRVKAACRAARSEFDVYRIVGRALVAEHEMQQRIKVHA